jgi:aryl-alcohol dehydrogenase-like predicted oxidoreductase
MRYLKLGKTGLEVSEVGFGGIPIIRLSLEEAVAVLRRALERGVTLFDTPTSAWTARTRSAGP